MYFGHIVHTGRSTIGWVTLLEVVVPGRAALMFDVYNSRKMRGQLSLAILTQADGLLPLAHDAGR